MTEDALTVQQKKNNLPHEYRIRQKNKSVKITATHGRGHRNGLIRFRNANAISG